MGNDLQELATKEDSSEAEDKEQGAAPKGSKEETPKVPRNVTNPTPLFGIPSKAPTVSFGTFDDAMYKTLSVLP